MTEISTISSPEEFEALRGEWDELVRSCVRPSPYSLHGWLAERWRRRAPEARVVVARRGGRLRAALPLAIRAEHGLRVGSFLGGSSHGLDLILDREEPLSTAAATLDAARDLHLDLAALWGLAPGSVLERLVPNRRRTLVLTGAPKLDLSEGWQAVYRRKYSAKRRNEHRRKLRGLGKTGAVEFAMARSPAEVGYALEQAFALHDLRWASHPRRADRSEFTGRFREYQKAALVRLAADDIVRVLLLRAGGRSVAFASYFLLDGVMTAGRVAFDPSAGRYSPGTLAILAALKSASEEGASSVDFGNGLEDYKLQLCDRVDPTLLKTALACTLKGRAAAIARIVRGLAVRRTRSVPALAGTQPF